MMRSEAIAAERSEIPKRSPHNDRRERMRPWVTADVERTQDAADERTGREALTDLELAYLVAGRIRTMNWTEAEGIEDLGPGIDTMLAEIEARHERARAASAPIAPQPDAASEKHGWLVERGVECVICPECAFTFDACHTDTDTDRYSCPLCEPIAQPEAEPLAAALRALVVWSERNLQDGNREFIAACAALAAFDARTATPQEPTK